MSDAHAVLIPLLNPNEPQALLATLPVEEGQFVEAGQTLCTLETTKSTAEVTAEVAGYVVGLAFQPGDTVLAGQVLCHLAASRDWSPPPPKETNGATADLPPGLRITAPALALARQAGLDLADLPAGPLITAARVRSLLAGSETASDEAIRQEPFDPTAIVVYGGGGHGKALIDLLRALGTYRLVGVVDDGLDAGTQVLGLPVLGGAHALAGLRERGVRLAANAVGGIGNIQARLRVFATLAGAGFSCPALVHPTAVVEPSASLSPGVQVMPLAYVGSDARIGYGAIVNTAAVVSHDCILGDYANLSPGALLAGGVQVGGRALIGMGVTVNLGVRIGEGTRVGNGATVKSDVPQEGVVRAGTIWPP